MTACHAFVVELSKNAIKGLQQKRPMKFQFECIYLGEEINKLRA